MFTYKGEYTLGGIAMVQLIVGEKGKGKTKFLLDKVNNEVKDAHGSIVYLDKSPKHMYELNNKIRLIVVPDYMIDSSDAFSDSSVASSLRITTSRQMYFDSFLKIANLEGQNITGVVAKLDEMSEKFGDGFRTQLFPGMNPNWTTA